MTSETNPRDDQPADRWPSDESLAAYLLGDADLLGDAELADRRQIERWLSADPVHGDHLVRLATVVLAVSRVSAEAKASDATPPVAAARKRTSSRVRSMATLLTLAASGVLALFSVDYFRRAPSADSRVAMAWAESQPLSAVAESDDISGWLLDPTVDLEAAGLKPLPEPADQDTSEPVATFGFSADEPPEWLIAAVSQMHAGDRPAEPSEDNR